MPRERMSPQEAQFVIDEFVSYLTKDEDYLSEYQSYKAIADKSDPEVNNFINLMDAFIQRGDNVKPLAEQQNSTEHTVNTIRDVGMLMDAFFKADKNKSLVEEHMPNIGQLFVKRLPYMDTMLSIKSKDPQKDDDTAMVGPYGAVIQKSEYTDNLCIQYGVDAERQKKAFQADAEKFNVRSKVAKKEVEQLAVDTGPMVAEFSEDVQAAWDQMPKTAWWHRKPGPNSGFAKMQEAYQNTLNFMNNLESTEFSQVDYAGLRDKLEKLRDMSMGYLDEKDAQKGVKTDISPDERKAQNSKRTGFGQQRYTTAWSLNEFAVGALRKLDEKMYENPKFKKAALTSLNGRLLSYEQDEYAKFEQYREMKENHTLDKIWEAEDALEASAGAKGMSDEEKNRLKKNVNTAKLIKRSYGEEYKKELEKIEKEYLESEDVKDKLRPIELDIERKEYVKDQLAKAEKDFNEANAELSKFKLQLSDTKHKMLNAYKNTKEYEEKAQAAKKTVIDKLSKSFSNELYALGNPFSVSSVLDGRYDINKESKRLTSDQDAINNVTKLQNKVKELKESNSLNLPDIGTMRLNFEKEHNAVNRVLDKSIMNEIKPMTDNKVSKGKYREQKQVVKEHQAGLGM